MLKQNNFVRASVILAMLVASGAMGGTALGRQDAPPTPQNKVALGQDQSQQSTLIVGSYKSGDVSRHELTNSAEDETDRLDKDKSGAPDVHVLSQPILHGRPFAFYGK